MPAKLLNSIAAAFSKSSNAKTTGQVSKSILTTNGINVYTALHEIAQVNIYKSLANVGYSPVLEQKIKSNEKTILGTAKTYEADIVANGFLWEVKPKGGASAKKQIEKYTKAGGYLPAPTTVLDPIEDISIIKDIYMKIEFPREGEARYSFYTKKKDSKGNVYVTEVSTKEVRNEVLHEIIMGQEYEMPIPMPVPRPLPLPIPI